MKWKIVFDKEKARNFLTFTEDDLIRLGFYVGGYVVGGVAMYWVGRNHNGAAAAQFFDSIWDNIPHGVGYGAYLVDPGEGGNSDPLIYIISDADRDRVTKADSETA